MAEPDGLRAEAYSLYASGDLSAALYRFQELLRLNPGDAETLNDIGTVYFALGRIEESVRHYARALRLQPEHAAARQNLSMVAQSTGRSAEALLRQSASERRSEVPLVTALLLNYRRPQNMQRVLDCLASQTAPTQVYLWNNGSPLQVRCGEGEELASVERHPLVRLVVTPNGNLGCWPRWLLGSMADTEYVCTLDDDLLLADDRVLEDAIAASRDKCPDGIVGFFGWERLPGRSYRASRHIDGAEQDRWVDLIKGRFMLLRRELLERVPLVHPVVRDEAEMLRRADDIVLSLTVSRGRRRAHLVPGVLGRRYVELSECGVGLRNEPGHREMRDDLVQRMFAAYEGLQHPCVCSTRR
jgi:hypothetical protein